MSRQLFIRVDPNELDRYERKKVPRKSNYSDTKVHMMDLFKRALQSLPPRELQMLYTDQVLNVGQEEASTLFSVRQSNMSYRLQRSNKRMTLFFEISSVISETHLREILLDVGMSEQHIHIILGVVKTTSQSATASAFNITQGSVRYIFSTALKRIETQYPESKALVLLKLVEKNYNQLRAIRTQERWSWKVRGSNYAIDDDGDKSISDLDGLCVCQ